ncbi:MAG: hypothetical protein AB8G22_24560 [Saprospiraceae bacterium]
MNYLHILIIVSYSAFFSCANNKFEDELLFIKVTTSLFDCEETNIHLKVIDAKNIELVGNSILPICLSNTECKKEFYNIQDTNKVFLLEGFLSKNAHDIFDYGCIDSKIFKILSITEVSDF